MKPSPLLDFWQKPAEAGAPVALFSTTFALDPDFFERNCLARFLEVSSVDEDSGSVDDVVASVELHELLQATVVTVLADRSAPVGRNSLLWDLLSCHVAGGLLHAKVTVLIWERATRVILGSANLTEAGYRRQIELGLAADLGPGCLFPPDVLTAIADELESYLQLVPGYDPLSPIFVRATNTVALFRERVADQAVGPSHVRVAFAPTKPGAGPLDRFNDAWHGPQPLRATHLSPFWDSNDPRALEAVKKLLSGRPTGSRRQQVAVVLGPFGQTSFSQTLAGRVNGVRELKALDQELRLLHAKCLLIESDQWVAALVGSSNHTGAGLGLTPKRHREMNVWLGAEKSSKEGKALLELIQLGKAVPADTVVEEPKDEDEEPKPSLPICFGLCRVTQEDREAPLELTFGIGADGMPADWSIWSGEERLLTRKRWEARGKPTSITVPLKQTSVPMYVTVAWEGGRTSWAVVADDRLSLPPAPALSSLRAQHLLEALASGRPLSDVVREELERGEARAKSGVDLDPLKRFEVQGSLLHRGRALAASLAAMQRRLERPVITLDTLRARIMGPLGPEFVALKVVEAYESADQSRADAVFTIAEIALAVGRVNWAAVLTHVNAGNGLVLVEETFQRLDALRGRLGDEPADLCSYAGRAIEEARRCLTS